MKSLNNIISSELLKKRVNLEIFGIVDLAWKKDDIFDVIIELKSQKVIILGGDVYKIHENAIEMTFDSWYFNDDGLDDSYFRSNAKAIGYITEYEKNNDGKFVYSIII